MALDPMTLLGESVRAVPAVKYALGVAGLLAVVAITRAIGLSPSVAAFGAVIVLLLMVVLLVFARLTTTAPAHFLLPVIVLMWGALALVLATASFLFSSVFFHWPLDFRPATETIGKPPEDPSVVPVPKVVPPAAIAPNSEADAGLTSGSSDNVTSKIAPANGGAPGEGKHGQGGRMGRYERTPISSSKPRPVVQVAPCVAECAEILACRAQKQRANACASLSGGPAALCRSCAKLNPQCQDGCR